jgi:glycosyltransferase involved in cell wall biosynthesis
LSGGWINRVATGLERWLYRQSTAVVAVTRPFCDHVDRVRGDGQPTALIPNGTLEMFFDPVPTDGGRRTLGVPDDVFLVTFAGTHGIAQALPQVLDAAERVPAVHFAFIGDGPVKEELVSTARDRALDNVHFYPQVPTKEIMPLLAASDALLVPLSGHPVFNDFIPSKMIDFMATGKPIVLAARGEAARVLARAGSGIPVEPQDAVALATAVTALAADPSEAARMGAAGRDFARRRMRVVQAERLEQVLFEAVKRG